jgi:hypothetical protein
MNAARSFALLVVSAALVTAVGCGKKTPPVARPLRRRPHPLDRVRRRVRLHRPNRLQADNRAAGTGAR